MASSILSPFCRPEEDPFLLRESSLRGIERILKCSARRMRASPSPSSMRSSRLRPLVQILPKRCATWGQGSVLWRVKAA